MSYNLTAQDVAVLQDTVTWAEHARQEAEAQEYAIQMQYWMQGEAERITAEHPELNSEREAAAFAPFFEAAIRDDQSIDEAYANFAYMRDSVKGRGNAAEPGLPPQAQPTTRHPVKRSGGEPGAAFASATDDLMADLRARR